MSHINIWLYIVNMQGCTNTACLSKFSAAEGQQQLQLLYNIIGYIGDMQT